jgi:hypothetical protein
MYLSQAVQVLLESLSKLLNLIQGIFGILHLGSNLEQDFLAPLTQISLKLGQFPYFGLSQARQETTFPPPLLFSEFLVRLHVISFLSLRIEDTKF